MLGLMNTQANQVTRREFMREGAVLAAGLAVGLTSNSSLAAQTGAVKTENTKTRSYHPQMEYRRLGKTNLWVSAVCMGGHWKRIEKNIGSRTAFTDCENLNAGDPAHRLKSP